MMTKAALRSLRLQLSEPWPGGVAWPCGWDSFRRRFIDDWLRYPVTSPPEVSMPYERILSESGARGGVFDVLAWGVSLCVTVNRTFVSWN